MNQYTETREPAVCAVLQALCSSKVEHLDITGLPATKNLIEARGILITKTKTIDTLTLHLSRRANG